ESAHATHPDVDADTDFSAVIGGGGDGQCKRLGSVEFFAARRALAADAELAAVDNAIPHQAVSHEHQPDQEDHDPSAFFNLYGHRFSLSLRSKPLKRVLRIECFELLKQRARRVVGLALVNVATLQTARGYRPRSQFPAPDAAGSPRGRARP